MYLILPILLALGLSAVFVAAEMLMFAPAGFIGLPDLSLLARPVMIGISLLMGLYFKAIHEELQREGDHVAIRQVLSRSLHSRGFWIALVASPIVLLSFLPSLSALESNTLVILVCFENGFFFRSIFERRVGAHATS